MEQRIPYLDYLYPKVTVVIPVFNHARGLTITLKSLMEQAYPDLEVIVIDALSSDRTFEVAGSFLDKRIKVFSTSEFNFYEMLNKGITHSTGDYLSFLHPGRYFLTKDTLKSAMDLVLEGNIPSFIYGAALVRFGGGEPKLLRHEFTLNNLKSGMAPTSLASCFFHKSLFETVGKFNPHYQLQGDLDLFCRIALSADPSYKTVNQAFSDEDQRTESRKRLLLHFRETMKIVWGYFGLRAALELLFKQRELSHYLKLWLQKLRLAFLGR